MFLHASDNLEIEMYFDRGAREPPGIVFGGGCYTLLAGGHVLLLTPAERQGFSNLIAKGIFK